MKKFNVKFTVIKWFNGGKREFEITKVIEARTIKAATNKARKMEAYGKSRTWYLLTSVEMA